MDNNSLAKQARGIEWNTFSFSRAVVRRVVKYSCTWLWLHHVLSKNRGLSWIYGVTRHNFKWKICDAIKLDILQIFIMLWCWTFLSKYSVSMKSHSCMAFDHKLTYFPYLHSVQIDLDITTISTGLMFHCSPMVWFVSTFYRHLSWWKVLFY